MDEILNASESELLGCYVNRCFHGALAYADDLLLLSLSLSMLQVMLDLCYNVRVVYNVQSV